ncbi:MAG: GFA family protein [Candidatus Andeanibacterium colombiense]|uniref:GFA family protein n=1 Tax=Candidatus Andeanibacterium colombiense TaxID=3121345 RepID=A0AAJ5X6C7_9SPHN|nr:MAG: GFA family protein [Sphingomonadaceae bacterium]
MAVGGIAGGCRCGAVRYRIDADTMPPVYACHCTRCQTASGSAFAVQMPVRVEQLTVEGEVISVALPTVNGAVSTIRHCPVCLTRLYGTGSAFPAIAIVRAGTLDDSAGLSPAMHLFTGTKQPWVALPDDVPAYENNPGPEVWARLLA